MGSNWDQAKKKIVSGDTGDKVPHPDPGAAPMGTGEEAAGARTPPEQIERDAKAMECPGGGVSEDIEKAGRLGVGPMLIYVGVGAVAVIVALALMPSG